MNNLNESVENRKKELNHPTYGKVILHISYNIENGFTRAKYIEKEDGEKIVPKDMKHSDKIFTRKAVKDIQDNGGEVEKNNETSGIDKEIEKIKSEYEKIGINVSVEQYDGKWGYTIDNNETKNFKNKISISNHLNKSKEEAYNDLNDKLKSSVVLNKVLDRKKDVRNDKYIVQEKTDNSAEKKDDNLGDAIRGLNITNPGVNNVSLDKSNSDVKLTPNQQMVLDAYKLGTTDPKEIVKVTNGNMTRVGVGLALGVLKKKGLLGDGSDEKTTKKISKSRLNTLMMAIDDGFAGTKREPFMDGRYRVDPVVNPKKKINKFVEEFGIETLKQNLDKEDYEMMVKVIEFNRYNNVDKKKLIGEGKQSKVYDLGDGFVKKIFKENQSKSDYEKLVGKKLEGIVEVKEVDDNYVIMEKVNTKSQVVEDFKEVEKDMHANGFDFVDVFEDGLDSEYISNKINKIKNKEKFYRIINRIIEIDKNLTSVGINANDYHGGNFGEKNGELVMFDFSW